MASFETVLVAALAEENRVIGDGMDLPWHLPEDLAHFKRITRGHPLLMGRRTFESIVHQFGGPLPERHHLVLTRSGRLSGPSQDTVEAAASVEAALARAEALGAGRLCIGGGASVYEAFLTAPLVKHVDRLELTLVEGHYTGDTYFPAYEHLIGSGFEETKTVQRDGFRFLTCERRPRA